MVAEEFCPELETMNGIRRVRRPFAPEDVKQDLHAIAPSIC